MMTTYKSQQGNGPVFEMEHDPSTHTVREVFDPETGALLGLELVAITPEPLADAKAAALAEIKQRRDDILRKYSEKLVIYKPNFDAALAVSQGTADTFLMPNGQPAATFAAAAAAAMNLTAAQWSAYILSEWQSLGSGVAAMENEYLRHTYHPTQGISALTTVEAVETALAGFRAITGG